MIHHNPGQGTVVNKSFQHLSEVHYREIVEERGIDAEWAKASCQSVNEFRAENFLGYAAKSPGIMFIGEGLQFQFKPDVPWEGKDGKKPKYRTPTGEGEYDVWLPQHPTNRDYWTVDQLKQNCYQIGGHPYIILTEGGFKAISGCSNGLPTVALMGVTMGLTPKGADQKGCKHLVETLKKYAEAKFGFIIAFDADARANKNVRDAERSLTHELLTAGCPVLSITGLWSVADGKGMDDFIQSKSIEEFRRILEKAIIFDSETVGNRNTGRPSKALTPRELTAQLAEEYGQQWKFDNEQKKWRVWTGKEWEKAEDGNFRSLVKTTIDAKDVKYTGSAYITDVLALLADDLRIARWQTWDKAKYINFNNIVLDTINNKTINHSPGMGFT